jgi:radical SAM superfamily enzyme YgiQ (UPF0313 family)
MRAPHFGLCRIYTEVLSAGYTVDVYDIDSWIKEESREWYKAFLRATNIGLEFERVTFVLGLEAVLFALYGDLVPHYDWEGLLSARGGHGIAYVDAFDRHVSRAATRIASRKPHFVMFSCYTSNVMFSLAVAQRLRTQLPGVRVVFGGPGCGLPQTSEFVLRTGFVDTVVVGEGEISIVELLANWSESRPPVDLPGVATLSDGQYAYHPRDLIQELDALKHTIYPEGSEGDFRYLPMEAGRGCIMQCGFCSESQYWRRYRPRPIASIAEELFSHIRKRKHLHVEFVDSLLNPSRERLVELCDAFLHMDREVTWSCDLRPTGWLDRELGQLLYEAGCRSVNMGAETFIPERLRYLRKGTTVDGILKSIDALTGVGITTNVHRMCCIKDETDQEILAMYDRLKEFKREVGDHHQWARIRWDAPDILRLEPFSPMFQDPASWGLTLKPFTLPLPVELEQLQPVIDQMCVEWDDGMPRSEKLRRNALIKSLDRVSGLVD